jgi:large conductance mechanosensitive channel
MVSPQSRWSPASNATKIGVPPYGVGDLEVKRTYDRRWPETAIEGVTMIKEFKDFLFRGNIIELAVAFVMGLAFAAVVNSLVNNLVMPIIAAIIGKPDFRNLTFTIHRSIFHYGAFITDLIQFVAIGAAVFFFIVKPVQMMLARSRREPVEEGMPDEERRHQELLAALRAGK